MRRGEERKGEAYVHVNRLHERLWATEKTDSDPGRKDFGQAVEPQHSADVRLVQLEGEVRWNAGSVAVVQIIVRVICVRATIMRQWKYKVQDVK